MVELSKAQMTGIVLISMILSGAVVVVSPNNTFYCQPEDSVKECVRVSSSGITCYEDAGADRCVGGTWIPIEEVINLPEAPLNVRVNANAGDYACKISQGGQINSYTECIKGDGKIAYLGELI